MSKTPEVHVRRVYEPTLDTDGYRVLVDRIWPRGLAKDVARLDEWCREVAPSTQLRRWYGHEPTRFADFRGRYLTELADGDQAAALTHLEELAGTRPLTLLTATKDPDISHTAVLADLLQHR